MAMTKLTEKELFIDRPIDLDAIGPGRLIRGGPSGPHPKWGPLVPSEGGLIVPSEGGLIVDGMDMKEVIEFLLGEIDSLNKRVKSLETKRS